MKLFELYESPVMTGASNLKNIANAATSGSSATIMLGSEPVTLEYPEARFIYGLYKKSLQNGQQEQFMQMLANPASFDSLMKPMRDMLYRDRSGEMSRAAATRIGQPGVQEEITHVPQNDNTLKHIVQRFPKEVKDFVAGEELDTDLYHSLHDYYSMHGEMPYGVAKARDGDPFEWVTQRFDRDVHDYITEAKLAYRKMITEGKKSRVMERYDDEDDDWYGFNDKRHKTGMGTTVTKTNTGVVHKGKYGSEFQGDDGDEDDFDSWGNKKPAAKKRDAEAKVVAKAAAPVRSRGRPSAAVSTTDGAEKISDYRLWYHKSKRQHPERKIVGSAEKAIAVVPKGDKYSIIGSWDAGSGSIDKKAGKTITAAQLSAYKSSRGRPKKVREFIENLRHVVESKNHMDETEYNTYSGWRAACKRAGANSFDGDRDICQALKDGKGVGEWDGATGSVYDDAHKKAAK